MPNQITAAGLEVATYAELLADITAAYESIYGSDINLDADTPDGQQINIFIQMVLDLEDLLVNVNANFDADQASGVILDQRVAINGIQRQAGTYTITNISIVTSQAVNLYGLDQTVQPVFTVSDNQGNEFELQTTQTISGATTTVAAFRAKTIGEVLTIPNTINVPVSIVLGVTSVNNPTTYTTLGINEESDADLRLRRQRSVSLGSQGYLAGLLAALENITGVTSALVFENNTSVEDENGVPGHSIWVIVAGTGAAAEIAQAIYSKRNAGCGMFGDETYNITQIDGTEFPVFWSDVETEDIFIKFTATSLDGINPPQIAAIKEYLVNNFNPGVNEQININSLAELVREADANCLVTDAGFCLTSDGDYQAVMTPTARNNQFVVPEENIIITPMLLSPASAQIVISGTQQFTGLGGFGTLTYSVTDGGLSGSIDSSTGLFTATTTPGTVTLKVEDSLGNYANATVTVI